MLYLAAILFAKLSTLSLVARLSPNHFHAKVIRSVFALVIVWGVTSVFASAFQCNLPRPWDTTKGHCFDTVSESTRRRPNPLTLCQFTFWTAVGSIDIITDIMLITLPYWIVKGLQMRTKARLVVILAFACRLV